MIYHSQYYVTQVVPLSKDIHFSITTSKANTFGFTQICMSLYKKKDGVFKTTCFQNIYFNKGGQLVYEGGLIKVEG